MTNLLFICHGNICRSPMAEFIFKDLVGCAGRSGEFHIESAATSREEIGNDIYPPAREILRRKGIPFEHRSARQMSPGDYSRFDLVIAMEKFNLRNILRIIGSDEGGKLRLLLDYAERPGQDIADPWYSGDFELAYREILAGCKGLLKSL